VAKNPGIGPRIGQKFAGRSKYRWSTDFPQQENRRKCRLGKRLNMVPSIEVPMMATFPITSIYFSLYVNSISYTDNMESSLNRYFASIYQSNPLCTKHFDHAMGSTDSRKKVPIVPLHAPHSQRQDPLLATSLPQFCGVVTEERAGASPFSLPPGQSADLTPPSSAGTIGRGQGVRVSAHPCCNTLPANRLWRLLPVSVPIR
jgi:hypothetical protein